MKNQHEDAIATTWLLRGITVAEAREYLVTNKNVVQLGKHSISVYGNAILSAMHSRIKNHPILKRELNFSGW